MGDRPIHPCRRGRLLTSEGGLLLSPAATPIRKWRRPGPLNAGVVGGRACLVEHGAHRELAGAAAGGGVVTAYEQ